MSWEFKGNECTWMWVCCLTFIVASKMRKSLEIVFIRQETERHAISQNLNLLPHCIAFVPVLYYLMALLHSSSWYQLLARFSADTGSPLPTTSFVLHCTNTIECTLNGYQVFPHSAALILLNFTVKSGKKMHLQCLVTVSCLPTHLKEYLSTYVFILINFCMENTNIQPEAC